MVLSFYKSRLQTWFQLSNFALFGNSLRITKCSVVFKVFFQSLKLLTQCYNLSFLCSRLLPNVSNRQLCLLLREIILSLNCLNFGISSRQHSFILRSCCFSNMLVAWKLFPELLDLSLLAGHYVLMLLLRAVCILAGLHYLGSQLCTFFLLRVLQRLQCSF